MNSIVDRLTFLDYAIVVAYLVILIVMGSRLLTPIERALPAATQSPSPAIVSSIAISPRQWSKKQSTYSVRRRCNDRSHARTTPARVALYGKTFITTKSDSRTPIPAMLTLDTVPVDAEGLGCVLHASDGWSRDCLIR